MPLDLRTAEPFNPKKPILKQSRLKICRLFFNAVRLYCRVGVKSHIRIDDWHRFSSGKTRITAGIHEFQCFQIVRFYIRQL